MNIIESTPRNQDQERLLKMVKDGIGRKEARDLWNKMDKSDSHFRRTYKNIKDDAVAKLIVDSLDVIDETKQVRVRLWRNFISVKLLMMLQKRMSAKSIAIECFNMANDTGLSDVAYQMAKHLRFHFARIEHISLKYTKYKIEARKAKYNIDVEEIAEELHGEVIHLYNKRKDLESLKPDIDNLTTFVSDSPYYHLHHMSVRLVWQRFTGRDEEAVDTCRAALNYFISIKSDSLPYIFKWNFGKQLSLGLLKKGKFAESEAKFRQVFKTGRGGIKRGSINFHAALLLQAKIGLHSDKIRMTEIALSKARRYKRNFKSELVDEEWRQVEAWIVISRIYRKEKHVPKFRISSYLNNVPHEFREKEHSNVQVRIIELMYHLLNGNKERFMEISYNIPSYIRNNLKGKKHLRQRLILESIGKIDENRYIKERVEKACSKNIIKISTVPISIENEWIPFERVWEMALSVLK